MALKGELLSQNTGTIETGTAELENIQQF